MVLKVAKMFSYRLNANLRLELLAPRHAQELFEAVDENREYLRRWMPWVTSTRTVADVESFIAGTREQIAANSGFQTAIRAGEDIVGTIGMHKIDWQNKSTSLGYWLAEKAQGQGIITRACAAYVTHAFTELNLHRVEIRCATENFKSQAVPKRLGFTEEAIVRQAECIDDQYLDHVVFGLLKPEWNSRTSSTLIRACQPRV